MRRQEDSSIGREVAMGRNVDRKEGRYENSLVDSQEVGWIGR